MYRIIHDSLDRQAKGLSLLGALLDEEYGLLRSRDSDGVASLEFSVHELIRQLAVEKALVIRNLAGSRVKEYAATLSREEGDDLRELFEAIDRSEQQASRNASRNAQLSLALLDQSTRNLQVLTGMAVPKKATTYCRRGGMRNPRHTDAALISGRL
jgi:flagellar biosynthesis/type III secretory pathway chaperone